MTTVDRGQLIRAVQERTARPQKEWHDARDLHALAAPLVEIWSDQQVAERTRNDARESYRAAAAAVNARWSRPEAPDEAWTRAGLREDDPMNRAPTTDT